MRVVPNRTRHTVVLLMGLMLLYVVAGCARQGSASLESRPDMGAAVMEAPAADDVAAEGDYAGAASVPLDTRKIIATAHMEMVVEDTEASATAITELAGEFGGYVSQANLYRDTWGGMNLLRGTLSLRVPADNLELFLAQLEAMALEVRSTNLDRQDVTDQYSDVEAQLRNLEATENELRELLAEVRSRPNASSEDILAVHRDLTQIRGEIEVLQGRQNMLDNQIALSTVDVTLIPDEASRPVVEERWRPAMVLRDASRALVSGLQFLGDLVIWIGVFVLPMLLLALIPLALVVWLIRTIVVRRRRKREVAVGDESP